MKSVGKIKRNVILFSNENREEEMLSMRQIEAIKELQDLGYGPVDISEKMSINRKTVAKYMSVENYSGENSMEKEIPSRLDRWKEIIESWCPRPV
jgi:hypothetical protein